MLQFMGENKKLLNFHEQKFSKLEASNTNSQNFQKTTNASLKNLETQIGQLALTVTPRPGRVYSTTIVGAYKRSKCHIVVFWRLK